MSRVSWALTVMSTTLAVAASCVAPPPAPAGPPIPPACGTALDLPAEPTGTPPVPKSIPIPNPEVVLLTATATPRGCYVGVRVDAIDQFGRHGVNADTGGPYPWPGIRREPYVHRIYFDPRLRLEVTIEVTAVGEDYELHGCKIEYQGQVLRAKVIEQPPNKPNTFTSCKTTVIGPGYAGG